MEIWFMLVCLFVSRTVLLVCGCGFYCFNYSLFCHVISASGTVLVIRRVLSRTSCAQARFSWPLKILDWVRDLFENNVATTMNFAIKSQGYSPSSMFFSLPSRVFVESTRNRKLIFNWENIVQFTSMSRGIKREEHKQTGRVTSDVLNSAL